MPIRRSSRRVASAQMATLARQLLDASTLCAIASVAPGNRAYINTAYFAWTPELDVVWLSEPNARHSRNLKTNPSVAVAVYDSTQSWAEPDRGIQLFGSARAVSGRAAPGAAAAYSDRFRDSTKTDLAAYRFYRFRPRRVKLFHEPVLGRGVFVTAGVETGGRLAWKRTDVYTAGSEAGLSAS